MQSYIRRTELPSNVLLFLFIFAEIEVAVLLFFFFIEFSLLLIPLLNVSRGDASVRLT